MGDGHQFFGGKIAVGTKIQLHKGEIVRLTGETARLPKTVSAIERKGGLILRRDK